VQRRERLGLVVASKVGRKSEMTSIGVAASISAVNAVSEGEAPLPKEYIRVRNRLRSLPRVRCRSTNSFSRASAEAATGA
jgi:hypothetical protein